MEETVCVQKLCPSEGEIRDGHDIWRRFAFEVAHVYEANMAEQMHLVDKFCDTLSKLQRLCDTM